DQPADPGAVGGHSDGTGQKKVLATVRHVVCREPVRHRPAAKYPSRRPTTRLVDRSSHCAVGAVRAGDGDELVHLRLGAARGLTATGAMSYPSGTIECMFDQSDRSKTAQSAALVEQICAAARAENRAAATQLELIGQLFGYRLSRCSENEDWAA